MSDSLVKKSRHLLITSRSKFQLEHFVVGQHDTPEMRYRQIILEARSLLHSIDYARLQAEVYCLEIKELEATKDEKDKLVAQQKRLDLEQTLSLMQAAEKELEYLTEIAQDYRPYTLEEIEQNQPLYWKKRLTRQAFTDRSAIEEGISVGNVASLIQAGILQGQITE